jgi:hypothetical protein
MTTTHPGCVVCHVLVREVQSARTGGGEFEHHKMEWRSEGKLDPEAQGRRLPGKLSDARTRLSRHSYAASAIQPKAGGPGEVIRAFTFSS